MATLNGAVVLFGGIDPSGNLLVTNRLLRPCVDSVRQPQALGSSDLLPGFFELYFGSDGGRGRARTNRGPPLPSRGRARTTIAPFSRNRAPSPPSRGRARTTIAPFSRNRAPSPPSRARARTRIPVLPYEQSSVASLPSASTNEQRSVTSLPRSSADQDPHPSVRTEVRRFAPERERASASRCFPATERRHFTPEAQREPASLSSYGKTRRFVPSHAPARARIPILPYEDPRVRSLPRASAYQRPCPSIGGPGSCFPPTRQPEPRSRPSDEGPGPCFTPTRQRQPESRSFHGKSRLLLTPAGRARPGMALLP
jgi:hypothetical protein